MSFIDTSGTTLEEIKERPWRLGIPLWIPGYTGQFAVGGVEVGGESDGNNFIDRLFSSELSLDFYFVGSVTYRWQQWDFHTDLFAGTIGKSVIFTLNDNTVVDATIKILMPRIYAGYDFLSGADPIGPITQWQAYLGGRYYDLDIEIDLLDERGKVEGKTSWFTFLIGTKMSVHIVNRLTLHLSGDIGGLITNNEPTLFGDVSLHYRPWDLFSVNIGYVAIHLDRVGESPEDIEFTADLAGPVIGIAFHL
ncbi:MAG: hypothetical protein GQ561_03150 [Calditrichae bacterium]|nr:hypothetical protein [Calditrichia bacterium]